MKRPGIVHRLDKDTSGVMVAAKTERAHAQPLRPVRRSRPHRPLHRAYIAFAWGAPAARRGTVDAPLGRDRTTG